MVLQALCIEPAPFKPEKLDMFLSKSAWSSSV